MLGDWIPPSITMPPGFCIKARCKQFGGTILYKMRQHTFKNLAVMTKGATIGGKFHEVTERTLQTTLAAVERAGGTLPCYHYHKHHVDHDRDLIGELSNFRRVENTIIADLTTAKECPREMVKGLKFCMKHMPTGLALSIAPKAAFLDGWELLVTELESIDLVDAGCASPGGLAVPTQKQCWEHSLRAARELESAREYFAEKRLV
jgi:hypothetical protein